MLDKRDGIGIVSPIRYMYRKSKTQSHSSRKTCDRVGYFLINQQFPGIHPKSKLHGQVCDLKRINLPEEPW
jgi:hypothetical protein